MKPSKKMSLLLLVCLLQVLSYAAKVQTITIYFAKDKYMVTGAEGEKLYALKNADLVMLHGHTDADGSNTYNEQLSASRVNEVKRIVAQIAAGARIETNHYGEYEPVNANTDEQEKTVNRRVVVSYVTDPLLRTEVPAQSFLIDGYKGQVIKCKQGTEIVIPAGTFRERDVTVQITEYYNTLEIFSANLSTRSNNTPIETAGMIYITAEANGKNLEPQKEITYKFPRKNKSEDFRFFSGERDNKYVMNWVLPKAKEVPNKPGASEAPKEAVQATYSKHWTRKGVSMNITVQSHDGQLFDSITTDIQNGFFSSEYTLIEDCLDSCLVTVLINKEGKVKSITSSMSDNGQCNRLFTNLVSSILPKSFPACNWESTLNVQFWKGDDEPVPTIWVNEGGTIVPDWSKDHLTTDYETDKIVMNAQQLGWINCDRFMSGKKLVTYTVKADTAANVRLIMNNYKSFFINEYGWNGDKENKGERAIGNFSFLRIPADEPVTIISTKKQNGKLYLALQTSTSKAGIDNTLPQYKEVTQDELEKAIKELKL